MKKSALLPLLFMVIIMTSNTKAQSSGSMDSKGQNHHKHSSHGNKDRHHKGKSFHKHHHHHGKDSSRSAHHTPHERKVNGDKKSNEGNKKMQSPDKIR